MQTYSRIVGGEVGVGGDRDGEIIVKTLSISDCGWTQSGKGEPSYLEDTLRNSLKV